MNVCPLVTGCSLLPWRSRWARRRLRGHRISYLEGGYIAGFVNEVEESGTITDNGSTFDLETDSGGGFIGGAWQLWGNMHLFGGYSLTSQDLEVSDGIDTAEGDFDVVRWRIGVGYAYPFAHDGLLRPPQL